MIVAEPGILQPDGQKNGFVWKWKYLFCLMWERRLCKNFGGSLSFWGNGLLQGSISSFPTRVPCRGPQRCQMLHKVLLVFWKMIDVGYYFHLCKMFLFFELEVHCTGIRGHYIKYNDLKQNCSILPIIFCCYRFCYCRAKCTCIPWALLGGWKFVLFYSTGTKLLFLAL